MGMHREASESDQVDDDQRQRPKTVDNGAENRCVRHERSGLHVALRKVTVTRFRIARTFCGA
jgi:hypothetical protein